MDNLYKKLVGIMLCVMSVYNVYAQNKTIYFYDIHNWGQVEVLGWVPGQSQNVWPTMNRVGDTHWYKTDEFPSATNYQFQFHNAGWADKCVVINNDSKAVSYYIMSDVDRNVVINGTVQSWNLGVNQPELTCPLPDNTTTTFSLSKIASDFSGISTQMTLPVKPIPLSVFDGSVRGAQKKYVVSSASGSQVVYNPVTETFYVTGFPSAAKPTLSASNVIPFYTDKYIDQIDNSVFTSLASDCNAIAKQEFVNGGDRVMHYTRKSGDNDFYFWMPLKENYAPVDLSAMRTLHVDIYPTTSGTIKLFLEAGDDNNHYVLLSNLAANQWNALEIPLSAIQSLQHDCTGYSLSNITVLKFAEPQGITEFYMDNLYFHSNEAVRTPMQKLASSTDTHLVFDNGDYDEAVLLSNSRRDVTTVDLRQVNFNKQASVQLPLPYNINAGNGHEKMNPNIIYYVDEPESKVTGENIARVSGESATIATYRMWDGWNYAPLHDISLTATSLRFYTSLAAKCYSFIVLPFKPDIANLESKDITLFVPTQYNDTRKTMQIQPADANTDYAVGMPFIIYTTNTSYAHSSGKDYTVSINGSSVPLSLAPVTTEIDGVEFVGTYTGMTAPVSNASDTYFWYNSAANLFTKIESETIVSPFYAYMKVSANQAKQYSGMGFAIDDDVTTSISTASAYTPSAVYTVTGTRLDSPAHAKGIYIVNGRKYVK